MSTILEEYEKSLSYLNKSQKPILTEHVVKRDGKWVILNKDRTKVLESGFASKEAADKRMGQIEYFKHAG